MVHNYSHMMRRRLYLALAHSPRLQSILKTARQQIREGEGISHEDFWRGMDEEEPVKVKKRPKSKKKTV